VDEEDAVNDQPQTDHANAYLQVMPRHERGPRAPRWHVFQVSDQSPRITLAGSVSSCEEARKLAAHDHRPLRIAAQAWQEMLAAGVAPAKTPNDVTLA